MLPLEDGRTPSSVVLVGDLLSIFTVAEQRPVGDDRCTGAVAYRTGRQCVRVRPQTPIGVRPAMPFPYATIATPSADSCARRHGHGTGKPYRPTWSRPSANWSPTVWCTPAARSRSGSGSAPTGWASTYATSILSHPFRHPCWLG